MTDEKKLNRLLKNGSRGEILQFYEYLYNEFKPLLIFVASKYLTDFEDIKDIVQDTFLDFFNSLNSNTNHTNIKALLTISCKNKAIDLLRRKKKIVYTDIEKIDSINDYDDLSHKSYKEIIEEMKTILSNDEMSIIIKHLVYGISLVDIAKERNTNISSIKSTYYRSIKKYKKAKGLK